MRAGKSQGGKSGFSGVEVKRRERAGADGEIGLLPAVLRQQAPHGPEQEQVPRGGRVGRRRAAVKGPLRRRGLSLRGDEQDGVGRDIPVTLSFQFPRAKVFFSFSSHLASVEGGFQKRMAGSSGFCLLRLALERVPWTCRIVTFLGLSRGYEEYRGQTEGRGKAEGRGRCLWRISARKPSLYFLCFVFIEGWGVLHWDYGVGGGFSMHLHILLHFAVCCVWACTRLEVADGWRHQVRHLWCAMVSIPW